MKWYYLLGLLAAVALITGLLVFYWFEPQPESLKLLDKDTINKTKDNKVTNIKIEVRDIDDTNLRDKNYNREKIKARQAEWQERKNKPGMSSNSYTNDPTECAKKHDRSLC